MTLALTITFYFWAALIGTALIEWLSRGAR